MCDRGRFLLPDGRMLSGPELGRLEDSEYLRAMEFIPEDCRARYHDARSRHGPKQPELQSGTGAAEPKPKASARRGLRLLFFHQRRQWLPETAARRFVQLDDEQGGGMPSSSASSQDRFPRHPPASIPAGKANVERPAHVSTAVSSRLRGTCLHRDGLSCAMVAYNVRDRSAIVAAVYPRDPSRASRRSRRSRHSHRSRCSRRRRKATQPLYSRCCSPAMRSSTEPPPRERRRS